MMVKGVQASFVPKIAEHVEFNVSRELTKAVACEQRLRSLEVKNKKVEIQASPLKPLEGLAASVVLGRQVSG